MWEVDGTDQFEDWFWSLDVKDRKAIIIAVDSLADVGPGLARPLVDTVKGSRHAHMKELRPVGNIRILFAFDPRRSAILLLGGDKTGRWKTWYDEMIPRADALYDEHLATLRKEGLLP